MNCANFNIVVSYKKLQGLMKKHMSFKLIMNIDKGKPWCHTHVFILQLVYVPVCTYAKVLKYLFHLAFTRDIGIFFIILPKKYIFDLYMLVSVPS